MPDATEWLVEHDNPDDIGSAYEHFATGQEAVDYLRQLVSQGKTGVLYHLVPFTVTVGVTVKAPRKRRRKESTEGAATPRAEEPTTKDAAAQEPAPSPVVGSAEPAASPIRLAQPARKEDSDAPGSVTPTTEGAERRPAPSSVAVWICEASFPSDAACPGPAEFDPVTRGRFCGFHLVQVPEGHRREMHRIHGHRNRPHEAMVRLVG